MSCQQQYQSLKSLHFEVRYVDWITPPPPLLIFPFLLSRSMYFVIRASLTDISSDSLDGSFILWRANIPSFYNIYTTLKDCFCIGTFVTLSRALVNVNDASIWPDLDLLIWITPYTHFQNLVSCYTRVTSLAHQSCISQAPGTTNFVTWNQRIWYPQWFVDQQLLPICWPTIAPWISLL